MSTIRQISAAAATNAASPTAQDRPDAVYVSTGRFGIVSAGTTRGSVLQTSGAGPCVIVAFMDARGNAALTHLHPSQDPQASVDRMLQALSAAGFDRSTAKAYMAGGNDGDRAFVGSVERAVTGTGFPIAMRDLLGTQTRALQVDAAAGLVRSYVPAGFPKNPNSYDGDVVAMVRDPRAWMPRRP